MENRKTFMGIFGPQNAESEENRTTILGQSENNTNYNTISTAALNLRSNSMETVWAFDNPTYMNDEKVPTTEMNEYGIPNTLQTTHMKDDYDPHRIGNTDNPTSFWGTVFHLVIISAGPAILTVPIAFLGVGYVVGFVVILLIVYLYAYNIHMIVWSEYQICRMKHIARLSYADTVFYAFKDGPPSFRWCATYGWYIINIVFMLLWIGGCCYNMVLISESVQTVYNSAFSVHIDVHTAMNWAFIPLLLLCWIRKLNYLVPFSILGNVLNGIAILVIIFHLIFDPTPLTLENAIGSARKLPIFFGSVLFTLNATGMIMPLKNEMKEPGKFDGMPGVLGISYVPTSFVYAFFGLFCCLKYGNTLQESVVDNLPQGQFISHLITAFYGITLAFQFPLLAYVVLDVIWNNLMKEKQKIWSHLLLWEYVIRTAIVVVVFVASYMIPDVTMFLSLSGTVGTSIDSMIFPAVVQTLVTWKVSKNKSKFNRNLCKNLLIITVAVVLIITGTQDCIEQIRNYYSGSSES